MTFKGTICCLLILFYMEQNLVDLVIHEIQIDQPLQWFLIINIGFVCIQLKILKKINN